MYGGNYLISMKQLILSEKIRIISILKYSGGTLNDIDTVLKERKQPETCEIDKIDAIIGQLRMNVPQMKAKLHCVVCMVLALDQ